MVIISINQDFLSPIDYYNNELKDKHKQNVEKYFDDLVKKSGIKIEENKQTIKTINKLNQQLDTVNKKISKYRTLKGLLIFLIIVLFVGGGFVLYETIANEILPLYAGILILAGCIILNIFFIILIKKNLNKKIKDNLSIKERLTSNIEEQTAISWKQMNPLNRLYDWNIASELITKSVPLIKMDKTFDPDKFLKLHDKYGFLENKDKTKSTCLVQSGSILGNPFLICKDYYQEWGTKTYYGSITIHWTETERDSQGHTRLVHRSQTLTASVTKPCPDYFYNTVLVYGCEAAPNLSFSRKPSEYSAYEEDKLDRVVRKEAKELDEMARESIMNGGNYTRLGNDEFEVLFGGTDRDDEKEFRMLFTPLAQKNELTLIKEKEPYGDDFKFIKSKCLNYICSEHSQKQDFSSNPMIFVSNDYELAKKTFVDYNVNYFRAFYYDMAPLMSIPLYQQHKDIDYIYDNKYPSNITSFEHEALANTYDKELFAHADTRSGVILKTEFLKKNKEADKVLVHAYSFTTVEHVDYISKYGGDGRYHNVPVRWDEYVPIENEKLMEVKKQNTTRVDFTEDTSKDEFKTFIDKVSKTKEYSYQRGLLSILIDGEFNDDDVDSLDKLLGTFEKEVDETESDLEKLKEVTGNKDVKEILNNQELKEIIKKINK